MSQLSATSGPMSNLGTPIGGNLNFQPGGNPYNALAGGGLAGLSQAYGQSYNSALAANQSNYNNIIAGYGTLGTNIANTLGQGGNGWGVAAPAAAAIARQGNAAAGGALQNSINNGTGNNSTSAEAAQRGVGFDTQQAYAGLGSQLASTYAGYQGNLGLSQLGFMNSVQVPYPDANAYNSIAQQYGQQQATAQQQALQQQALQMQLRSSGGRPSGGGVSTPQMPGMPGATYQPSGSGLTPGGFGLPSSQFGFGSGNANGSGNAVGYQEVSNPYTASGYGAGSPDLQTGSGSFDPNDPYGMTGDFGAGFGGDFGGFA